MDFNTLIVVITTTLNIIGLIYAVFTYKNTFEPRLILKYMNPEETDNVGTLRLENLGKSTAYDLKVIPPKGLNFKEDSKEYADRIDPITMFVNEDDEGCKITNFMPAEFIMNSLFVCQTYDLNPDDYIEFPYWVLYKNGSNEFGIEESADGFKKDSVFIIIYKIKFFNLFKKKKTVKLKANPNIIRGIVYKGSVKVQKSDSCELELSKFELPDYTAWYQDDFKL